MWYLPYYAVVTENQNGLKLRMVFDASRKTHTRQCCNEHLLSGPPLQADLLVFTNWRQYHYAFTADIVKMFRQVQDTKTDRDLQKIVWSPSPDDPPQTYRLNTLTYGTCAPYLAMRMLQ